MWFSLAKELSLKSEESDKRKSSAPHIELCSFGGWGPHCVQTSINKTRAKKIAKKNKNKTKTKIQKKIRIEITSHKITQNTKETKTRDNVRHNKENKNRIKIS
jgi:hypothetical protein